MIELRNSAPVFNLEETLSSLYKVADLIEFEGPLLSLFRSPTGQDYLYYWCDRDDSCNRWLIVRCRENQVKHLLARQLSLYEIITTPADPFVYCVDLDSECRYVGSRIVSPKNLPEDYLPAEDDSLCTILEPNNEI